MLNIQESRYMRFKAGSDLYRINNEKTVIKTAVDHGTGRFEALLVEGLLFGLKSGEGAK